MLCLNLLVSANQKSIIDKHTHTKKRNPNTILKRVINHMRRDQKRKTRKKFKKKKKSKTINKVAIKTYILIITLNVNGLITPTKRQRLTECERVNS